MTTPAPVLPEDTLPGFAAALQAVQHAGGVLLTEDAARVLVTLALYAAHPHILVEAYSSIAADLAAPDCGSLTYEAERLRQVAEALRAAIAPKGRTE